LYKLLSNHVGVFIKAKSIEEIKTSKCPKLW
jgi:hypothetical protein